MKRYGAGSHIIFRRENGFKAGINPANQRVGGAKITAELKRRQAHRPNALVFRPEKEPHFCLPEAIDGLHGIAHDKQGLAFLRQPALYQFCQQLKLMDGGILEFIHQHVMNGMIKIQCQIRRGLLLTQREQCLMGDVGKIYLAGFQKYELQVGGDQG